MERVDCEDAQGLSLRPCRGTRCFGVYSAFQTPEGGGIDGTSQPSSTPGLLPRDARYRRCSHLHRFIIILQL